MQWLEDLLDRMIERRARRLLDKALKVHGPSAEYFLIDTCQIQTKKGPTLFSRGETVTWGDLPNHVMQPHNDAARAVQKAYHRTQTATVLVLPPKRTLTMRERMRARGGDYDPPPMTGLT